MKKIILVAIFIMNIFGAMITGNQSKVSITGGSMDVTSGGHTITVNSGEITSIGENTPPSKAKKIDKGDMNDVYHDLNPSLSDDVIYIKMDPINPNVARQIRLELIKKGIDRDKIEMRNINSGTQISLKNIALGDIKTIYAKHYRAGYEFFKKPSNEGKVPTINIKENELQQYHGVIFQKYNN